MGKRFIISEKTKTKIKNFISLKNEYFLFAKTTNSLHFDR